MALIITILAFFLSSNDKEFSLIVSSNFIGSPLSWICIWTWLLFYAVGLLCIAQIGMHMLSPGSCNNDFFA